MTAKELMLEQGSDKWLLARQELRNASETPAIMGISPYMTANDVRKAKLGQQQPINIAMQKGCDKEQEARTAFEDEFELMRQAVFSDGTYSCSLDGISLDNKRILEVKVPFKGKNSERWKLALLDNVRPDDFMQIQHQLMVTGADEATLWVWDAESCNGLTVDVLPNKTYWDVIKSAWDDFWPTIGERDDKEWVEAEEEYIKAVDLLKIAQEKADRAKEALTSLVQGKYSQGRKIIVNRLHRSGNINWKKVKEGYLPNVDLEPFREKGVDYFSVKIRNKCNATQ